MRLAKLVLLEIPSVLKSLQNQSAFSSTIMPSSIKAEVDVKPKRSSSSGSGKETKPSAKNPSRSKMTDSKEGSSTKSIAKSRSDPARAAAKVDGRAKALGVGGLAALLHAKSAEASSSRTSVEAKSRSTKKGGDSKGKTSIKKEEVDDAVEEEQDRGMMLHWASQAIATSKGGISLEEINEDKAEASKEKAAKRAKSTDDLTQKVLGSAEPNDLSREQPRQVQLRQRLDRQNDILLIPPGLVILARESHR